MSFFIELFVNGVLAGAIYALIGLAFVVVYKASRMINFALGEIVMLATKLVTFGLYKLGLGLIGAIGFGSIGIVAFAMGFNRLVLSRFIGRPLIALIMVTIGLGIVLRASATFLFSGIPGSIPLPIPQEPIVIGEILISADELVAAALAFVCIAGVSWFFHWSRIGVALRAMSEDQQAAMLVGININHYIGLTWALAGLISLVAGILWIFIFGGGFGVVIIGLKVLPIVIIGGLDSILGVIIGAMGIGVLENMAAGYLDPLVGGGFSSIASYLVVLAVLFLRPHGLFGKPEIERVGIFINKQIDRFVPELVTNLCHESH